VLGLSKTFHGEMPSVAVAYANVILTCFDVSAAGIKLEIMDVY